MTSRSESDDLEEELQQDEVSMAGSIRGAENLQEGCWYQRFIGDDPATEPMKLLRIRNDLYADFETSDGGGYTNSLGDLGVEPLAGDRYHPTSYLVKVELMPLDQADELGISSDQKWRPIK